MILPNVWSQGQLFAFSALDGESLATKDFVGTLCGDKIGIRFHTAVKRELCISAVSTLKPDIKTVAGDIIEMETLQGNMSIIYADTHTVIGNVVSPAVAVVLTEGVFETKKIDDIEIQVTNDGDFTAILRKDNKFAFAYGNSLESVVEKVKKGIELDLTKEADKKKEIYKKHSLDSDNPYATLYAKFLSVMKTQLYSPEGRYDRIWSTPDRLPHKYLWLWDSVFHAIGHRNINPVLAEDLVLDIFASQGENGFIPHLAFVDFCSGITQPPVIAWGSYLVYQKSGNKEFLSQVFNANRKFLEWCQTNRRDTEEELYTWLTQEDTNCRCDESGMDNSPRFDIQSRLQAIDFSCFMANDVLYMAKIADILGLDSDKEYFEKWYNQIKSEVNQKLWCEEDGFYYDYDLKNKRLHKVQSVASFLPLFAGICDENRAARLVEHLTNPEEFGTPFSIPSISKKDATYGSDMWRGPVWINYNYMIAEAIINYDYKDLALQIEENTLFVLDYWYKRTGTVYEYYDPENVKAPKELNRKGKPYEPYDFTVRYQSIRDYGWSNTLGFDLLHNR